jgi:dynein intermediate chain 1, axonemal
MCSDDGLDDSKELRNQFNFSERAAQTSSLYPKDKETITEPPPTMAIIGTCCQSVIYDEYVKDQERLELQERMAKMKAAAKKVCCSSTYDQHVLRQHLRLSSLHQSNQAPFGILSLCFRPPVALMMSWCVQGAVQKDDPGVMKEIVRESDDIMQSPDLGLAAKVLERMVNQNTYDDIAMDFKYWDDASDQFKTHEGTLLPLWKFTNERARKKSVTSVSWSPVVSSRRSVLAT